MNNKENNQRNSRRNNQKQGSKKPAYGKQKDFNDFEEFEDLEDFGAFIKATGWKGKNLSDNSAKKKTVASTDNNMAKRNPDHRNLTSTKHQEKNTTENQAKHKSGNQVKNQAKHKSEHQAKNQIKHKSENQVKNQTKNQGIRTAAIHKENNRQETPQGGEISKKSNVVKALGKGLCSYRKVCGGCDILAESYQQHLSGKQKEVEALLKNYCKVEPIIGMEQPEHYRYKVHAVFDHDRKGNPVSGIYEEGTHRVIPIDQCMIHNEKADAIIATIRGMLKSFKILTYDEDTGYGLLRHVLIRVGYHSGEIMVVLVLASPIMPSKNNFVKALRKEHPEITTVVVNVNDKNTSMVLGEKEQVIYGKGYIEDTLCGKTFRISPKSFYQVNPRQTELLYNKAIELAALSGTETVVDAYCGIGTIGLIASDHAGKVIGVELNKDAVHDAVTNAKRNSAENIEFYSNDAGVFLSRMAAMEEKVDVLFMDPPRAGSTVQFLDAVAAIKPDKVIYISCNPVTLERDLAYITKKGYRAQTAVSVDMFPWVDHVEVIIMMTYCGRDKK